MLIQLAQLPQLHPIATTREVSCSSALEKVVSSPTTVCNSPQTNDAAQAELVQLAALLGSLGVGIHRQEAPQNAVQLPIYGASADAVSQPMPIPTRASLLTSAVPVNNAVANAHDQRLAQRCRSQRRPPPICSRRHRPRVLSTTLTTATYFSSQRIAIGSRNDPASAFVHF